MNTNYVFPAAQVGEIRNALLYASGPSSYTPFTGPGVGGDSVYNPGSSDYINFPFACMTLSGNYHVRFIPTAVGLNQIRAGGGVGGPSQSGWTALWEYASTNDPVDDTGSPLAMGTLSAAATQSTFTANGVLTVATTTPPPVNSFVVLSNGTSAAGIIFNGSLGQVVSVVPGVSYTMNFGAMKSLNYTVATDTLKYQVVQVTPTNLLQLGTPVTVTSVAVASNVLTVVCAGLVPPGTIGVIQGLVAGEVPQGAIVQVLAGSTSTGFTANIIAANLSATSGETATFTPLVTNGNSPLTVDVANTITGSTVAATATISTAAGKITTLPVAQSYVPGQLFIVQGLTHGAALNGQIYSTLAAGLTGSNVAANGYIATAVTTGTADLGSAAPLIAGYPPNGLQVQSGANLSAEQVQFAALVSSL